MIVLDSMEYATDSAARAAWVSGGGTNLFTGGTASANSSYSADYNADKAFDGNEATRWAADTSTLPNYISYDLGEGNDKLINCIKFLPFTHEGYSLIKDFLIKGSEDGVDWDTLSTEQSPNSAAWQTFNFANTTAYRHYRLHVTSGWHPVFPNSQSYFEIQGYGSITVYSESTIKQHGSYSAKFVALQTLSLNTTLTKTCSPTWNLSGQTSFKFDVRSNRTGSNFKIGIHDSGGTTTESNISISSADTWEEKTIDISAVSNANKDAIDSIVLTITNADDENTIYLDYLNTLSENEGAGGGTLIGKSVLIG
jgi:hypothetical protein